MSHHIAPACCSRRFPAHFSQSPPSPVGLPSQTNFPNSTSQYFSISAAQSAGASIIVETHPSLPPLVHNDTTTTPQLLNNNNNNNNNGEADEEASAAAVGNGLALMSPHSAASCFILENTAFSEGVRRHPTLAGAAADCSSPSFSCAVGDGMSYCSAVRLDALNTTDGLPSFIGSLKNNEMFSNCSIATSLCASVVDPKWAEVCANAQPFGFYLGTALDLVPAYSNGAVEDISHGVSFLPNTTIYCGMPWECLEYARRFLIAWYGITFASMDGACSLFKCDFFMYLENFEIEMKMLEDEQQQEQQQRGTISGDDGVETERGVATATTNETVASSALNRIRPHWTAPPVTVRRVVNGEGIALPPVGALLLYPIVYPAADMPFGHVAVVVERSAHHIRVAEQNWDNSVWAHHKYSRQLEVSVDEVSGRVTVVDEEPYAVLGWLDFTDNERRPPTVWDKSYANDTKRRGPTVPVVGEDGSVVVTSGHEET